MRRSLVAMIALPTAVLPLGERTPPSVVPLSCVPRFSVPELVLELDRDTGPFVMLAADFDNDGPEDHRCF